MLKNSLGQPIDEELAGWLPARRPDGATLTGRYCRLERLRPNHAAGLFEADQLDTPGRSWTYLPYGPFTELAVYEEWVQHMSAKSDPTFYAVIDTDAEAGLHAQPAAHPNPAGQAATERSTAEPLGREVGVLSFLRIAPESGSIEVGHVHLSPLMQRTRVATEAQYLMMCHVFETLGYRRYEWKCDALNADSRAAALRLGFRYEGTFRQATVVKGRNRDTAWFSITDKEWPEREAALEAWLDPHNFDQDVRQKAPLARPS